MTEQERCFLQVYRRTLDPGEAFLAAGMVGEGTPEQNGKRELRRLKKQLRGMETRLAKLEVATPERVRAELAHMAFDDIGRYLRFYEGANGFEVHARPSDQIDTRNIAEVSVGTGGKVVLKLYSKERALLKLWDLLQKDESESADPGILEALRCMAEEHEEGLVKNE
jgi:hypothetical protein